jgi:hypothetical protein
LDQTTCREERLWANIPPKSNRNDPICFSPYLYRARNRIERFAFVQLASIRLWLRDSESMPLKEDRL